jgi:hypothetical protein
VFQFRRIPAGDQEIPEYAVVFNGAETSQHIAGRQSTGLYVSGPQFFHLLAVSHFFVEKTASIL